MVLGIEIAAALYLLWIGMKMETPNMTSFMLFKFAPVIIGFALGLVAVAQWQHWPLVV